MYIYSDIDAMSILFYRVAKVLIVADPQAYVERSAVERRMGTHRFALLSSQYVKPGHVSLKHQGVLLAP